MTKDEAMREAEKILSMLKNEWPSDSNGGFENPQYLAGALPFITEALLLSYRRGVEDSEKAVCAIVTEGGSTQEAAEEVREAIRRAIKPLYRSLQPNKE